MQETQNIITDKKRQEFFSESSKALLDKKMDDRLGELEAVNERLVRRVKVGRNDQCPCGSGRKFKRCCISKVR